MHQELTSISRVTGKTLRLPRTAIAHLVETFYARAQKDELLGPVFAKHVEDWDEHLPRMVCFWSSAAFGERSFQGNPMLAHLEIGELQPAHFERWLELFKQTLTDCLEADVAEHIALIATRMENHMKAVICVPR